MVDLLTADIKLTGATFSFVEKTLRLVKNSILGSIPCGIFSVKPSAIEHIRVYVYVMLGKKVLSSIISITLITEPLT